MKLISDSPNCVLQFDESERYHRSFIFDIHLILDVPVRKTKRLIIRDPKKHSRHWSMDWRKFNRSKFALDTTILIDKKEMRYHP